MAKRVSAGLARMAVPAQTNSELARLLDLSEVRFRAVFESSVDCLFYVRPDAGGRLVYEAINAAGMRHLAVPWAEAKGRGPAEVMGAAAGETVAAHLATVFRSGEPHRYQPAMQTAMGAVVFDALYSPVRDTLGKVVGVLGSARDITRQKHMEGLLHQSQKMEALGTLAGGVAHDFNNLLANLQACFELLGRHVAEGPGRAILSEAARIIERGAALTGRLVAFSRLRQRELRPVRLGETLRGLRDTLARTLGHQVVVAMDIADDLWLTVTDVHETELAIINLAVNARDAMPDGGRLTLRARNLAVAATDRELVAGRYVCVTVADTGTGMAEDVLSQATEPFYTTKAPGKGTGLGLSIVATLMQQIGGSLQISSAPGMGTAVSLYFPASEAAAS